MKRGKDAIKVKERCCIRDEELSKICRKMFKKRSIYLISNKRLKPQMERLNNCNFKKKQSNKCGICVISIDLQLIHVLACNVFILIMKCHLWEVLWFLTKRIVWLTLYVSISWVWHVNDLEFIMIQLHADLDNQHIKIDNLCVFVIKNMLLIYF